MVHGWGFVIVNDGRKCVPVRVAFMFDDDDFLFVVAIFSVGCGVCVFCRLALWVLNGS